MTITLQPEFEYQQTKKVNAFEIFPELSMEDYRHDIEMGWCQVDDQGNPLETVTITPEVNMSNDNFMDVMLLLGFRDFDSEGEILLEDIPAFRRAIIRHMQKPDILDQPGYCYGPLVNCRREDGYFGRKAIEMLKLADYCQKAGSMIVWC